MITLYMVITADEYELPIKIEEDINEIGKFLRMTGSRVRDYIKSGSVRYEKYRVVSIEVEEDERSQYKIDHDRNGDKK